jgi:transcription factor SPN1
MNLTLEQDLEEAFDDEIAALKIRMEQACEADNSAREKGQPAIHKLKMLPEVVALLNRNTVQLSIVDPDTNFLQSVKFFLEPLNDGSLPAYNIQRDLFAALTRLPIEKEALLSSGIGKVVLYYTKSKKPEIGIKRTAERLLGEWSRPILKRSDDYKKRKVATAEFDHQYVFNGWKFIVIVLTNIQNCATCDSAIWHPIITNTLFTAPSSFTA